MSPAETARAVLAVARAQDPWALPLLADLVTTNSHADNAAGLAECRARLRPLLADLGFPAADVLGTSDQPGPGGAPLERAHLYARRESERRELPTVLLLGHLDTVFPPDHAFQALRRDREVWNGPGVSDMKGGVVTALVTLATLRERGELARANWRILFVCDEEQGSPTGASVLAGAAAGVDVALCFEAARECGGVVVARKGYGHATVHVRGQSGHAGIFHDRGVNALTALARFVVDAEALEAGRPGLTVSPGGAVRVAPTALSCIPDEASCELEWRFVEPEDGPAVARALVELGARISADSGARITVDGRVETPPMAQTPRSATLLAHYVAAADALGMQVRGVATAGVGDINLVARAGAVCLDGVGPEGGGFHTEAEYLDVSSIARRAAMNVVALGRYLD